VPRARQLARLNELLAQALEGRGQVGFLTGEAGSGKSTLIQEFTRRAQAENEDLLVVFGDCNAQTGAGDPYLPFREILSQLTGEVDESVAEGVITQENAHRLRRFLRDSGDTLLDVGADVIGIFVPGASLLKNLGQRLLKRSAVPAGGSTVAQKEIFEQYTEIIRRVTHHRPLILLLDDLHWADRASVDLLFHLARRIEGSRVMMLGTYRPQDVAVGRGGERHPLEATLAEVKRYYGDAWIELEEWDATEQRRFVDALVDTHPNLLSESFREALLRHTEGHPLFTVELLRSFVEQGIVAANGDGRLVLTGGLDWETLPSRVEGVIEARIGRLDAELREILRVASVQGEDFMAEVVARVSGKEDRVVIRRLSQELDRGHEIVAAVAVERIDGQRLSSYRFRHNLFQKYVYSDLDEVERSYLHDDVGRFLERIYGDRSKEIAVQLARHFREAGEHERAAHYQEEAGDAAASIYADNEARLHYARTLDTLVELPDTIENRRRRVDVTIKLVRVSYLGESPQRNLARLEQVEPLAATLPSEEGTALGDPLRVARVQYWMGRCHFMLNAPREAIRYYRKVLEVAPQLGDPELLALPASVIGRALVSQGYFEKAIPLLQQALEPLESTANVFEWIHTVAYLGTALAGRGSHAEAVERVQRAMARAVEMRSPTAILLVHIHTCGTHIHGGDRRGMRESARHIVDGAQSSGDAVALYVGLGFLGWAEASTDRYAEAAETMRRCRDVGENLGQRLVIADWFAAVDAEIALGLGEEDAALTLAQKAVELARSSGGVFAEARAHRTWARALAAADPEKWEEVEEHMRASLQAAESACARPELARTYTTFGALCHARGDHAAALAHFREAARILDSGVTALDVSDVHERVQQLQAIVAS
jgi:tetratricopeptide (TPR) repeat protein